MGIKRCKLSKKIQLRLLEYFVLEVTARSAADVLGLQANTAALFYRKVRELIAEHAAADEELLGGEASTTNNRMELTAAIEALKALKRPVAADIYTDSQYVIKGLEQWLPAWKARGWQTADKKPVKNKDLWVCLDELAGQHQLSWHWVKGHAGNPGNTRADALANQGVDQFGRRNHSPA
mgnify:CR=1 FL=1